MIAGSFGLILLALIGAPLFLVISGSALLGFLVLGRPAADVTGEISKLIQMDTLVTIPLFTFAGYMLAESGSPRRLVAVCRALFGWAPGGMAVVTLFTCAFFTTFTGASGITIVALGGLLLPVLLHQGYPRNFALGLITSGGSRGLVFPPSLPVIIYGYVAALDITRLYVAGILPGIIDVGIVMFFCIHTGVFKKIQRTPFDLPGAMKALWVALPEVLLPVWLIALIVTGVLKVPEAAALTALYVLIVEVFIYRDVHPIRDLPRITKESMVLCGAILIIIGASLGLTNYLVQEGVPGQIVEAISTTIESKWVFLLALNLFLLVVGCMMDIFSAIVIVVPLLTPLAAEYGVNPIHLAIIFLINLELGFNTPPVGMNLFIASFRFRQPIIRLYRAAMPYVLLSLVALGLITYVPWISTFTLPEGGGQIDSPLHGTSSDGADDKAAPADKKAGSGGIAKDFICDSNLPNDPDCDDDIDIDIDDDEDDADDTKSDGDAAKTTAPPDSDEDKGDEGGTSGDGAQEPDSSDRAKP